MQWHNLRYLLKRLFHIKGKPMIKHGIGSQEIAEEFIRLNERYSFNRLEAVADWEDFSSSRAVFLHKPTGVIYKRDSAGVDQNLQEKAAMDYLWTSTDIPVPQMDMYIVCNNKGKMEPVIASEYIVGEQPSRDDEDYDELVTEIYQQGIYDGGTYNFVRCDVTGTLYLIDGGRGTSGDIDSVRAFVSKAGV